MCLYERANIEKVPRNEMEPVMYT